MIEIKSNTLEKEANITNVASNVGNDAKDANEANQGSDQLS